MLPAPAKTVVQKTPTLVEGNPRQQCISAPPESAEAKEDNDTAAPVKTVLRTLQLQLNGSLPQLHPYLLKLRRKTMLQLLPKQWYRTLQLQWNASLNSSVPRHHRNQ